MPTIKDVAKKADVAPVTVSRVINNSGNVSAKTRARVAKAIAELGYTPNRLARSLRLKRTQTLALVVTDITNPFWTTVLRGVEDAAHDAGYSVILCNTDESETKQRQYLDVLLERRVDGILLVPTSSSADPVERLHKQDLPVVVVDRQVLGAQVDVVRADSEEGAYQLVRHLLSQGHRRIAALSGPKDVSTARDRVAGYCRALSEAGLQECPEWVRYGRFSRESGYEMTQQVFAASPRPTAVFAINNFIAIGVLRALKDAGLSVPKDVSVVAFDDLMSDLVIEPFLTVIDQPSYEIGREAAELLLARLSGEAVDGYREIVLPAEIKVRGSTARPAVVFA